MYFVILSKNILLTKLQNLYKFLVGYRRDSLSKGAPKGQILRRSERNSQAKGLWLVRPLETSLTLRGDRRSNSDLNRRISQVKGQRNFEILLVLFIFP